MSEETIGFIGLGNIGKPIADNIARAGFDLVVFDIAGTAERAPDGAAAAASAGEVAARSSAVFLSLPSVAAVDQVVGEIADAAVGEGIVVVNTSTVGPSVALAAHDRLQQKGIAYVDAPVSGGVFRAREGKLSVMFSGEAALLTRLRPVLDAFGTNIFDIGAGPGQGQRMKLLNNSLVISAFVSVSEALAYGEKGGLDMKTMLDVVNVSTGQNFVTEQVFPRYVLTETYASAGAAAIIRKDLSLFIEAAEAEGRQHDIATAALNFIEEFDDAMPGVDQLRMYPFIRDRQ